MGRMKDVFIEIMETGKSADTVISELLEELAKKEKERKKEKKEIEQEAEKEEMRHCHW
jgi:hypothetical protein